MVRFGAEISPPSTGHRVGDYLCRHLVINNEMNRVKREHETFEIFLYSFSFSLSTFSTPFINSHLKG